MMALDWKQPDVEILSLDRCGWHVIMATNITHTAEMTSALIDSLHDGFMQSSTLHVSPAWTPPVVCIRVYWAQRVKCFTPNILMHKHRRPGLSWIYGALTKKKKKDKAYINTTYICVVKSANDRSVFCIKSSMWQGELIWVMMTLTVPDAHSVLLSHSCSCSGSATVCYVKLNHILMSVGFTVITLDVTAVHVETVVRWFTDETDAMLIFPSLSHVMVDVWSDFVSLSVCVCVCVGSHAAGYDSDPSTPMVYSCSTQYRIHTHGVFRGIQVGLWPLSSVHAASLATVN